MLDSYVQVGNVFVVPTVRYRLNFAVLVRRAFRALAPWKQDDVVAVALPPSVEPHLRAVLARSGSSLLPVSMLLARSRDEDHREVFPITPADGIVEAFRVAAEYNLNLACVDRELTPGTLVSRTCLSDPDWPDDAAVLRLGVQRYVRSVRHLVEQPPIRFDPVDTWRELHIAENVRRLVPRFRRVLLVCEVPHLDGICEQLSSPPRQLDSRLQDQSEMRITAVRPNVEVMFQYLDDFPKLVERFERYRQRLFPVGISDWPLPPESSTIIADSEGAPTEHEFDKWLETLYALQSMDDSGSQRRLSTRALLSFRQFLRCILEQRQHMSARPLDLRHAAEGCFGAKTAAKLLIQMGTYGDLIDFERIGKDLETGEPVYQVTNKDETQSPAYVRRSCNPARTQYVALPRPIPLPDPPDNEHGAWAWPQSDFCVKMRSKAANLADKANRAPRTMLFRGSLEAGIDARRTLRSQLTTQPGLFVKEHPKSKRHASQNTSPMVWLSSLAQKNAWNNYRFRCVCEHEEPADDGLVVSKYSLMMGSERTLFRATDGSYRVNAYRVLGRLSFFDVDSLREAKAIFGKSFSKRVPNHDTHTTHFHYGCINPHMVEYAESYEPWWDLLLIAAIEHADDSVLCIVPDAYRHSPLVCQVAKSKGVTLSSIHMSQFTREERRLLSVAYIVHYPKGALENKEFVARVRDTVWNKLGLP